ncbi:MAG: carbamoyl-phosphate synthase large subunit [Candidatus Burarchaeum sp.]|nr:carbamoyl-phosphate synthase large subunit [Candidatus Burarchaeum sp.]MDO8339776.1 carbamoyl-phosphate synthase large subunit [Candidatus Burarchaeum sp.]
MPKRHDIKKVLVIGSGPIVIGQAAEFDYSGSQACQSLREEGVKVVLVNSNPATIQTDLEIADIVYIEPLRPEFIEKIIAKEKPQGIIGTMGGQTGLNLTIELRDKGILEKYGVEVLGTNAKTIEDAEDRKKFADLLIKIGEPILPSVAATATEQAHAFAAEHGYPLILRPAYTLGGTGGGIAYDRAELEKLMKLGLSLSPIHQVLVEKSVIGWAEIEYEVMRDAKDNCITICNMENVDPMGVHTGESIVVAPSQTLSDDDYQMLRSASLKIIRALGIKGGCNIQFGLNQKTAQYYVIEVNPRLSRSSALASKATGYPIARVAAKIALGYTLDEVVNAVTKRTPASFEPALDYVVVKIPRWPFDKMPEANRRLGTQMKSTGEVMAIGRTFEESLNKALRSLEVKKSVLEVKAGEELEPLIKVPNDRRLNAIFAALRKGKSVEEICELSNINPWFIRKMKNIVEMEKEVGLRRLEESVLRRAKKMGLGDRRIAELTESDEMAVRKARLMFGIKPVYKMVDTCAAEFEATTPYYYSTYEHENEAKPEKRKKVIVIGSGPIRIGQGIEFDYCCCHASFALREAGVQSIMINNNPETISTDFDASDRLYFEPLTYEDVMNVIENEQPDGVVVQFGGQTGINLAEHLHAAGVKILGTQVDGIDIAEDRERFRALLHKLGIPQPANGTATNEKEALEVANKIGYPIIVRPSYVIAGRGMAIIYADEDLKRYIQEAVEVSEKRPVLIDKYLENAREVEIDGVSDADGLFIAGIMEHIERAGVHSGDASCVTPPVGVSAEHQRTIVEYSEKISMALKNIGAINVQYAIRNGTVYVLEANPRGSRTMPYLSKATGVPIVKMAMKVLMGRTLKELGLKHTPKLPYYAVKSVVFPFLKLAGVDIVLGPEMKSTGESMGIDRDFGIAYYKALLGAGVVLPMKGKIAISLNKEDKGKAGELAGKFLEMGYTIGATDGTAIAIGKDAEVLKKASEGTPNIITMMEERKLGLIINTPQVGKRSFSDGFKIRRAALENSVPLITNLEAAFGMAHALKAAKEKEIGVRSINEHVKEVEK